ncbi:hypothetical protein BH10PLA1_BH10PLA1_17520 [soil metagenome]
MNADERSLSRGLDDTSTRMDLHVTDRSKTTRQRNLLNGIFNLRSSAFICGSILLSLVGCSDSKPTTKPSDIHSRQDAALKDPFGYSVDIGKQDSVSGGGTSEMDKDGLKRDIDHVFNP